jgi:RNA polymerase sigma-70 factor, ECF subfamily
VPPSQGAHAGGFDPAAVRSATALVRSESRGNDEPTDEWPVQRGPSTPAAPAGAPASAVAGWPSLGGGERSSDGPRHDHGRADQGPRPSDDDGDRDEVAPTWDEIAEQYGATVYTMAYRLTGDRDEARDLAQDVFVRVYRNLDRYRPGTFEGWLYRITKNLFLDRMRRRNRVRVEPLPEEEWRQPSDVTPGPADRIEAGMLRGDLERALQDLPPLFRTAVVLCDVQGLSYEEVAQATGWPLGTVRSRIHRGRRLLRRRLAGGGRG